MKNIGFLLSLVLILTLLLSLVLTLLSSRYSTKPILITIVVISSLTAYFTSSYHVIIDESMIRNTLQTNLDESMDLFSIKQLLYFIFLGLLPAYLIYRTPLYFDSFFKELKRKIKSIIILLILIATLLFSFSQHYTSFLREHKPLRYTVNPTYWIYSIGKYIGSSFTSGQIEFKKIALDAKVIREPNERHKIVIMVIGEAVRADHFSLNGYERETNPLLKREKIVNFSNFYSCGTSTATSVPCMFSSFTKDEYSYKKGVSTENILDVLNHTGEIAIEWRDNNSDSKGVALRVPYQSYKSREINQVCDVECRDEGMLIGLDKFIETNSDRDILILLHQMGNHGPAYYKRYKKEFEKFKPICATNQLEECEKESIANAYDNAILYTDYFLSQTINFLKKYDSTHKTAMIYMSDHGESLGESGVYLHGLPYFIAPEAQTHVASLMWFSEEMEKSLKSQKIKKSADKSYSHDNLFHSLLGIFNVQTEVYNKELDIFH